MGCVCKTEKIEIVPNKVVNVSVIQSIDKKGIKLGKQSSIYNPLFDSNNEEAKINPKSLKEILSNNMRKKLSLNKNQKNTNNLQSTHKSRDTSTDNVKSNSKNKNKSNDSVLILKENSKFNKSADLTVNAELFVQNKSSFGNVLIHNKLKSFKHQFNQLNQNNSKLNKTITIINDYNSATAVLAVDKQMLLTQSLILKKPVKVKVTNSKKNINNNTFVINQKNIYYYNLSIFINNIFLKHINHMMRYSYRKPIELSYCYSCSSKEIVTIKNSSTSNLKLNKKTPYTLLEFKANTSEQIFNCWCKANTTLNFCLEGKWSLDFSLPVISGEGYFAESYDSFPVGCLLGRISNEDDYFPINNWGAYTPKTNGFLILKLNCNEYYSKIFSPEGLINITVKEAERLNSDQMQSKLGFVSSNNFEKELGMQELLLHNEFENGIIKYMNEVRLEPKTFAFSYLKAFECSNDKNKVDLFRFLTSSKEDEINKEINEMNNYLTEKSNFIALKKEIKGLQPNKYLKRLSNDFCCYLEKNKKISKIYSKNESFVERCKRLSSGLEFAKKAETLFLTEKNKDSLNVVIELLLDKISFVKINRKNLLNEEFCEVGITTKLHNILGRVVVIDYSEKI